MIATRSSPRRNGRPLTSPPPLVVAKKVAIYTRKSVEAEASDVLTSLTVQRELVEKYIQSQREKGWVALEDAFDDNGYSGATMDRPALRLLLEAIQAGRVQAVAVYRLDRLSRRQLDLLRLLELFQEHRVVFLSVTETLNSDTPAGRAMINMLGAFAQLERETIAERTRDNMRAARRRGMWTGGRVVLGYRLLDHQLTIEPEGARQVQEIFRLYREEGSLLRVCQEVRRRSWWTPAGKPMGKDYLSRLLRNPLYAGRVRCGEEVVTGRHPAIVDPAVWEAVGAQLDAHQKEGVPNVRNRHDALLKGLLWCGTCGSAMTYTRTSVRQGRRYAYYVCGRQSQLGAATCPGSRIQAEAIERSVVARVAEIGQNHELVAATVEAARRARATRLEEMEAEGRRLAAERERRDGQRRHVVDAIENGGGGSEGLRQRLTELDQAILGIQAQEGELVAERAALEEAAVDEEALRPLLEEFQPVWEALFPRERMRVLRLLLERVEYDARRGEVVIRPRGPLGGE